MTDELEEFAKELGHEPLTLNTRSVVIGLAALMAVMFASLLVIGGLALVLSRAWGESSTVYLLAEAPEFAARRGSLVKLRETENKLLTEYAWIDANAGIARVPIARAMQLLSTRLEPTQTNSNAQPNDNP
jgi:hypothetical protein